MNRLITSLALAAICMSGFGCAVVPHRAWEPVISTTCEYGAYLTDQGPVVSVPFTVGVVVGMPVSLATMPLTIICKSSDGGEGAIAKDMSFFALGPWLMGDIVATPFLVVKKMFWDFPRWLFIRKEDEDDSFNKDTPSQTGIPGST